jgi:peptidoglycan/LPS O-acetylase OafA/YrhL
VSHREAAALRPSASPADAREAAALQPPAGTPADTAASPVRAPAGGARLAWLDALRGIAALFVVFDHLSTHVLQSVRGEVYQVIDPGLFGVFVFFLVSGYIVPASLERKGSVRTFWVSRLFRLFPLFIVAVAAVFVLHGTGLTGLRDTNAHPTQYVLAHLFMLSDLLGGVNIINVLWTLSYEMVFYLLLTALFTVGIHKRSGWYALALAAGALLLGGVLPRMLVDRSAFGGTRTALVADIAVMGGLAFAVAGHRFSRTLGALLAGATGLTLVLINERAQPYEGLTILALMFTGTLLYRAERGQVNRRLAWLIALVVFACTMAAGAWHIGGGGHSAVVMIQERRWVVSLILAMLLFGLGLVLRKLPVPAALAWLGLVSYSIYLLHPLLVDIYTQLSWTKGHHPLLEQFGLAIGFLAVLLACCAVTYYLVEAPMQRLGRRLAKHLDARRGPDRITDPQMQPG